MPPPATHRLPIGTPVPAPGGIRGAQQREADLAYAKTTIGLLVHLYDACTCATCLRRASGARRTPLTRRMFPHVAHRLRLPPWVTACYGDSGQRRSSSALAALDEKRIG